jgi:hypothetical protein
MRWLLPLDQVIGTTLAAKLWKQLLNLTEGAVASTSHPTMFLKLLISVAGSVGAYALYQILKLVWEELNSPLRHLPGPKSTHLFYGNLKDIWKAVITFASTVRTSS